MAPTIPFPLAPPVPFADDDHLIDQTAQLAYQDSFLDAVRSAIETILDSLATLEKAPATFETPVAALMQAPRPVLEHLVANGKLAKANNLEFGPFRTHDSEPLVNEIRQLVDQRRFVSGRAREACATRAAAWAKKVQCDTTTHAGLLRTRPEADNAFERTTACAERALAAALNEAESSQKVILTKLCIFYSRSFKRGYRLGQELHDLVDVAAVAAPSKFPNLFGSSWVGNLVPNRLKHRLEAGTPFMSGR